VEAIDGAGLTEGAHHVVRVDHRRKGRGHVRLSARSVAE